MFVVVYHFKVPPERAKEYVMLEKRAMEVCLEHGCLGVEIYRDVENPTHWMEINRFKNREHYLEVMKAVERDSRIRGLYEEFATIIDVESCEAEKKTYLRML